MNIRRLIPQAALALALLLAAPTSLLAQAPAPVAAAPAAKPAAANADKSYILGPEDVIEIEAVGHDDFKSRVKVATDGTVQLPYLGTVVAANKTTQSLSDDVKGALEKGGFFSKVILRVEIVSYASRYVTVLGNVGTPGLVPIDRPYRLSEILARVGGVREGAADYVVLTPENGPSQHLLVKTLATGDSSQDPYVSPGEKIYAPDAEIFYISGQVKAPGAYGVATNMTLRMALSRGGGITDLGTERAVDITRGGKKLTHQDLDSLIQAGDVIVVGERLF
jgi:polysaccharide export outer membrane protein